MRSRVSAGFGAVAIALSVWLPACGDCEDETAVAEKFLETPTNLSCQSNADCEVVSTGCGHPARSSCGQAQLNHPAAASSQWKRLQADLVNCDNKCEQCGAALLPTCSNGLCGGAP